MATLTMTVAVGAGDGFLDTVVEAVNNQENVYIVVAGEYGHLHVESIEDVDPDE